jgi:hypothetical protein
VDEKGDAEAVWPGLLIGIEDERGGYNGEEGVPGVAVAKGCEEV